MAVDADKAVKAAASKLGSPYVWGATGPSSFDCSGLTSWAWHAAGVTIPRTSQAQATYGKEIPLAKIQPGDLVTSNWGSGPSSHVALYVGGGKVIHAPRPGKTVTYANLDKTYQSKIDHIRRVPNAVAKGGADDVAWWDPLGITDGLGKALGAAGLEGLEGAASAGAKALGSIGDSIGAMGTLATFLMQLALPSTWIRIVCGALGVIILFLGLGFLVREARAGGA